MTEKTISQLEAEGYTHIECACKNPACRNWIGYPFALLRRERPKLMLSAMTIAELSVKMKCGKCGSRDVACQAARQQDAPGFATRY